MGTLTNAGRIGHMDQYEMYLKVCLLYHVLHRAVFEKKTAQGDWLRADRMKTLRSNDYYFFSFEKQAHPLIQTGANRSEPSDSQLDADEVKEK